MSTPPATFAPSATSRPVAKARPQVKSVTMFGVTGVGASSAATGRLRRRFRWRLTMPS
ncbi:MAG: hypothetical protein IPG47_15055 [Thermoflexaceae bacterium]|nr:hypothetical protein [Thermoflexaceae bacterium]